MNSSIVSYTYDLNTQVTVKRSVRFSVARPAAKRYYSPIQSMVLDAIMIYKEIDVQFNNYDVRLAIALKFQVLLSHKQVRDALYRLQMKNIPFAFRPGGYKWLF